MIIDIFDFSKARLIFNEIYACEPLLRLNCKLCTNFFEILSQLME